MGVPSYRIHNINILRAREHRNYDGGRPCDMPQTTATAGQRHRRMVDEGATTDRRMSAACRYPPPTHGGRKWMHIKQEISGCPETEWTMPIDCAEEVRKTGGVPTAPGGRNAEKSQSADEKYQNGLSGTERGISDVFLTHKTFKYLFLRHFPVFSHKKTIKFFLKKGFFYNFAAKCRVLKG